jgi:hypothetical protein
MLYPSVVNVPYNVRLALVTVCVCVCVCVHGRHTRTHAVLDRFFILALLCCVVLCGTSLCSS